MWVRVRVRFASCRFGSVLHSTFIWVRVRVRVRVRIEESCIVPIAIISIA